VTAWSPKISSIGPSQTEARTIASREVGLGGAASFVGHSHYEGHPDQYEDTEDFTIETVDSVLKCTKAERDSFHPNIPKYFGYRGDKTFWDRVLHFNYLPDRIGDTSARYKRGSPKQFERVLPRFARILDECLPDKVFIFTPHVWNLPSMLYDVKSLGPTFPTDWWEGKYRSGDHIVRVYRLRHPQGARDAVMIPSVQISF